MVENELHHLVAAVIVMIENPAVLISTATLLGVGDFTEVKVGVASKAIQQATIRLASLPQFAHDCVDSVDYFFLFLVNR